MTITGQPPRRRPAGRRLGRAIQLTSAQIDQVVARYAAGTTARELAARFGVHRHTITKHLHVRGVQAVHSMNETEIARAIELYGQGRSLARVGQQLGFDTSTVQNVLRRAGVHTRDIQGRVRG